MAPCDCAPSLHDLVNDPLTRLLMDRDGVEPAEVVRLMTSLGRALTERKRRDSVVAARCGATRRHDAGQPRPRRLR
ncbi:MAG: hypothetical protein WCO00_01375 [Rhodospirillaceae bacterium]